MSIFIPAVIIALILIVSYGTHWFLARKNNASASSEDEPILSSSQLVASSDLQSVAQGSMAGYSYNMLANASGRVMINVTLDHDTLQHIIAIGDKSNLARLLTIGAPKKRMERVELEGDFNKYIRLYCGRGQQESVREVFTPDVMQLFADFCRAYDMEIFHETLYISQAQGARDVADNTVLVTDATSFFNKCRPVFDGLGATPAPTEQQVL